MTRQSVPIQHEKSADAQSQALLATLHSVLAGNLDAEIQVPEDDPFLTDLASSVAALVNELKATRQNQENPLTNQVSTWNLLDEEDPTKNGDERLPSTAVPTMRAAVEQESVVTYGNEKEGATLAVPINLGDEILGVMGFTMEEVAQWSSQDLAAVEAIAEQVGLALEKQRLFDQTQEALSETLAAQRRFTRDGWTEYISNEDDQLDTLDVADEIMEEAIQQQRMITRQDMEGGASLALPINYSGEVIGVLGFDNHEVTMWDEEDLTAVQVISDQLALALENQRLIDQTQSALSETQTLYDISARLNAAETLDALIEAASLPAKASLAHSAGLFLFDLDEDGIPYSMRMEAFWARDGKPVVPIGAKFDLETFSITQIALNDPSPILIEDFYADERVDVATRMMFEQTQSKAAAIVPLRYGESWVGLMMVRWDSPHKFTQRDQNVYQSIATQTATALSNRLLFEQVQARAAQSGKLAQIEAEMSQADDEAAILKAVSQAMENLHTVSLHYVDTNTIGQPIASRLISQYGSIESGDEQLLAAILLHADQDTLTTLNTPFAVENVSSDNRLNDIARQITAKLDIGALVLLPLRSGGRWQALILFSWPHPYQLSNTEKFLLLQLLDPIAAIIASRRALTETEILYQANADLVAAQGYAGIVDVLCTHTILGKGQDVSLNYFDIPWTATRKPRRVSVLAWHGDGTSGAINTEYALANYPTIENLIHNNDAVIIEDVSNDSQLDGDLRELYSQRFEAKSILFVPLIVGEQQMGYLQAIYQDPIPFPEAEVRLLTGLAGQAAAASERVRLLEQTRDALLVQERLSSELRTVSEVGTITSTIMDVEELLQTVVDLTKTRFGLYHTHIYLMHENGRTLSLRAGADEVGRLMTLEEHAISIHANAIVARTARSREATVVNDTRTSEAFLPHPLLPHTRAELAVPMIVADNLVGVLDVQSDVANRFTEQEILTMRTLASQIAVAVQNAEQYAEQVTIAEKLRDVDKLKSEFLASMSHELRTPLNSIIGFADVLLEGLDGELNERMEQDVRLIRDSGDHLRNLIGDILDMSKIEAGRMELRYEDVDMRRMANDIVAAATPLAQEKNLEMFLNLAEDVSIINADRTRIRQVLTNIVGNAIKFTEKGHVSLGMEMQDTDVLISVQDTGIGIKPENIAIVFEQFRQVDGALNRKVGGTGLGMPISKNLVELHGGRIWIESTVGVGTTFWFTIPVHPQYASANLQQEEEIPM